MSISTSYLIADQRNQSHVLEIGPETLLLNGIPATIVEVGEDQVVLGTCNGSTAFTYAALGQAILGDRPSFSDAGLLLVQYFARWSALQAIMTSLKSLQACLGQIMTEARPWLDLPLPPHRFDELTRRALDAFDGTEEITRMLARILGQSPETVIAWAHQLGKTASEPPVLLSNGHAITPELVASCMPIADAPVAVSSVAKSNGKFHWNAQMVQQLETDYLASTAESVAASVREIADRYGWPAGSIQSKLYELELPQRKRAEAAQREAKDSAQEDHPSNENSYEEQDGEQA